jgi:hypothetical protein
MSLVRDPAAARAVALLALLGGCSSLLGIHELDDAAVGSADDATTDGVPPNDGRAPDTAPIDAMPDSGVTPVHIGEYTPLGASTTVNGNFIIARRFTVGGTTTITGAGAYLTFETANGKIKFAVYNDNANSPFTLRVTTTDITLDGTAGYNDRTLGPHTLQAGTYWIVMATDSSLDIGSQDTNNVLGAAASLPYAGAFPSTYNPQPTSSTTTDRINLYLQAQP